MVPTKIILHHSATKDSGTVSWNAIRRYHMNDCAWDDIGYHFGIEYITDNGDPAGSYEILMGRMPDVTGAHTTGQNSMALGICFVGNFDEAPPPIKQWKQGLKLVKWICREWGITPFHVYGHRQFANKTCPGTMFDVDQFIRELL